jgi:putative DNA primase/helicase
MDFIDFARSFGIIIHDYPPMGVWKRYPTEDHPRSKNGAVKYMGTHGFVQNHAMDTVVSIWKPDRDAVVDRSGVAASIRKAEDDLRKKQQDAAQRAVVMLNNSGMWRHQYLESKGFEDEQGNVLRIAGKSVLLIPMRVGGSIVGCQLIDEDGTKKFLYGQRTSNATFVFGRGDLNILCEGYATALSVRMAMKQLKRPCSIHVCFSAGNMIKVAEGLVEGLVIADNDASETGEATAKKIGWKYWISDTVGEDANDYHKRVGLFKFTQSLTRSMLGVGSTGVGDT